MAANPIIWPTRLFITGTDTGVGKTMVSAILMMGLNGSYWKPIQSGLEEITDTEWVQGKTGIPKERVFPETYRLQRPLSPHASAKHEGVRIDLEAFHLPDVDPSHHLIVEGAGGIMVPLNEQHLMLDLMKKLQLPILLVARGSLGTINHTLLSLEQLRRHNLDILGVVMNGEKNPDNRQAIEYYGNTQVLAELEPLPELTIRSLKEAFLKYF
ncbi:MAG: dethiobiotin synthase [Deltaproteobacteria bacterium]|nr:dethiobiotin synthase [Deltaproteobacteria bacterium]